MINVDKQMMIENFPKLKRRDHSPKQDQFIDVSLDPPYFSLDSPFNMRNSLMKNLTSISSMVTKMLTI
jgi:hypothetical protein